MTYFHRLIITLLVLWSMPGFALESIISFHSDIEVRRNGDLYVTETIRVEAEGKSIRRGIFRDFPTRYKTVDGRSLIVGFEVLSVKRDGADEPYHIKNQSNGQRVYIGDKNTYLSPGIYEYQLSYLTTRQLGFFDDYDELYWNVTGNGWRFDISQASARVTLPDAVSDFELTGYTGPQGSTEQNLKFRRVSGDQVYFETSYPLRRNEGLTIVAAWPKGLIKEPTAAQKSSWFYQDHKASLIVAGGSLALFGYYLLMWRRVGRDPETGIIVPLYQAPPEYSPASMRYIQNMGYDNKCFSSAIINLAVKGALDINSDDDDFKLLKNENQVVSLAAGEAQVYHGLFGGGRGNISIVQSNHKILSKAIKKHKKSLKRDYEKKYFNTNSRFVIPGVVATLIVLGFAIHNLHSEEVVRNTVISSVFSFIPLIMISAMWRGLKQRSKKGKIKTAINLIALLIIASAFLKLELPLGEFVEAVPIPMVVGIIVMLSMHYFFYQWLKAPTLVGRRLLDKIEGFKHYLEVAEEDEISLTDAPEFTLDIYESYLPYAIALDLENQWTAKLDRAIASGLIDSQYSNPGWYHSRGRPSGHFSNALSGSFESAIASSSAAPGSSSGSSGGSSGGGGGGGGGGGW